MARRIVTALALACLAIAFAGLAVETINLRRFPALRPRRGERGAIAACVAVRDEERNVRACIEGLLAQPEIGTIAVCDDGSRDRTPAIVAAIAAFEKRVVAVSLPDSSYGSKSAALAIAAAYAMSTRCRYLLFTDADVRLDAGAAGALLARLREMGAQAVAAWPRVLRATIVDVLLAPMVTLLLLQALPMWRSGDPRFAAGNGQLFLIEAEAYRRCGGHAAIDGVVEDVALAQNLTRSGSSVAFASAAAISSVRGYGSLRSAIAGLGRSLYAGGGIAACLAFAAWQTAAFVLPYALLAFAPTIAPSAVAAGILARAALALRMREGLASVVLTPASAVVAAAGAIGAAVLGAGGRLTWRGRPVSR